MAARTAVKPRRIGPRRRAYAYTGGLAADDPALIALVPQGLAIACGARGLPVPLRPPARQE